MPDPHDRLNRFARPFALALQRSTRLPPLAGAHPPGEAALRASTRHLPGAGLLVGALAAFVFACVALLSRGNPAGPGVAAVASVFAVLVLTGAAQESAVFRVAESLARRAAGHGTIAIVMLLAARLAGIAAIGTVSEAGVLAALLAAPAVSRFAPLLAAHWAAHAAADDAATVRVAALWCVVPLLVMWLAGGFAFLLLALAGAAVAWIALLRFLRGEPGNFDEARGAALQQACEAAFYLGASFGA